jgi:predicted  nucleic acid-binding Zn-ribbon protein
MNQAQHIIPRLRQLAELEGTQRQLKKNSGASASLAAEIESLRALLPTAILSHHDHRRARGKISVAPVTRGICGACHLAIPRGHLGQLRRVTDDLSVCDHCGVFVYLAEEDRPTTADSPKGVAGGPKKIVRAKRATRCPKTSETVPAR